jgi:hypothetical protein
MVSGVYSVGHVNSRVKPSRPSESPPLPPLIRVINPPPSPPLRVSSLFSYLPEETTFDFRREKMVRKYNLFFILINFFYIICFYFYII